MHFLGALSRDYIGHWGGITFAKYSLEQGQNDDTDQERSMMRHVEAKNRKKSLKLTNLIWYKTEE